jgi:hypothetical protein
MSIARHQISSERSEHLLFLSPASALPWDKLDASIKAALYAC